MVTFGGMCMLAQSRGGACFCTRGAMQGYDVVLFILALAKTVTPGGSPRREPGRPAPPLKLFHFDQKILAVQKPMTYTDLLANVTVLFSVNKLFYFLNTQILRLNRYHTWARVVTNRYLICLFDFHYS